MLLRPLKTSVSNIPKEFLSFAPLVTKNILTLTDLEKIHEKPRNLEILDFLSQMGLPDEAVPHLFNLSTKGTLKEDLIRDTWEALQSIEGALHKPTGLLQVVSEEGLVDRRARIAEMQQNFSKDYPLEQYAGLLRSPSQDFNRGPQTPRSPSSVGSFRMPSFPERQPSSPTRGPSR